MPVYTSPALDATNRPYKGKGLQTLSSDEMKRLDKGLLQRMGNHTAFCITRGIDPKAPFVWEWVGDVAPTLDADGYKAPILDEYMLTETYGQAVRLQHTKTGVQCVTGEWAAEHCFGLLDIPAQRQARLAEDAQQVHNGLKSGDAGYEKNPLEQAFEGVVGYNTQTPNGFFDGNAETELTPGKAVAAWRGRFGRTTRDAILAGRNAQIKRAREQAKTPQEGNKAAAKLERQFIAEDEATKHLR